MATYTQRTVLITGCSSGIGLCTAEGLQQRGYRVFATARQPDDVAMLQQRGLESLLLDLDDSASIEAALEEVLQRSGGNLYALFNNGAYGQPGAVEDLSRDTLRRQFETNFFGTFELTNRVIAVMRQQGHGRLIFNSSILGFAAMPFRGAYNASKFAMEGLCDTLRLELAGTDIHVALVEPGPITSRFRHNAYRAFVQNIDRDNSVHRELYAQVVERLQKEGPAAPFTLGPEAVLARVVHALEARRPKVRYYVTVPTYLFAWLRHLLPYRVMDWLQRKAGS